MDAISPNAAITAVPLDSVILHIYRCGITHQDQLEYSLFTYSVGQIQTLTSATTSNQEAKSLRLTQIRKQDREIPLLCPNDWLMLLS